MPERVQRRRTPGWRKPEGSIYVGRPSAFGNPFRVGAERVRAPWASASTPRRPHTAATATEAFRRWLNSRDPGVYPGVDRAVLLARLSELRGKDLVCWCPLVDDQGNRVPCHADVLLEMANR